MSLELPQSLPKLVQSRYDACRDASKLIFAPSEVTVLHTNAGLPFQLRYCPSLAKKPTSQNAQAKKSNPFENPDRDMVIADVPSSNPSHYLMLNKFPIIPYHFMLVTKTNKAQTRKLEQDDLEAVYACLYSWDGDGGEDKPRQLFAFFNSGEHSGASQTHRHVQFIPVESMAADIPGKRWELLMSRICAGRGKVPFTYFWSPLPQRPSAVELYQIYTKLHDAAASAVRNYIRMHPGDLEAHDSNDGSSEFSYNLGITTSTLIICPRRREGTILKADDGSEIGFAALNGTLFAGSMMIKHKKEWDYLRSKSGILDEILESIAIPSVPTEDSSNAKI